jgi:hypothetical protein
MAVTPLIQFLPVRIRWAAVYYLFLGTAANVSAQSQVTAVPTVLVVGYRVADTLTRTIAMDVRNALARAVPPSRLIVLSTAFIDAQRNVGAPDDFGGTWGWADVRMAADHYRATVIIDLVATQRGDSIEVEVNRVRPPRDGLITALSPVKSRSITDAVQILTRRLANDTLVTAASRR